MGCAQSRIDNEESVSRCKDRKNLMREAVAARNAFAAGHSGYAMALKNTGAALFDYAHGETHLDDIELHPPPLHSDPPPPLPLEESLPPPPPLPPNFSPASLKRSVTLPPVSLQLQHRKIGGGISGGGDIVEEVEKGKGGDGDGLVHAPHAPPSPPSGTKVMPPPPFPDSKNMAWDYFFMDMDNMGRGSLNEEDEIENEEGEIEGENVDVNGGHVEDEIEPKTPEKVEVDVYNKEHEHEDDVIREATHIEHSKTAPAEFRRAIKVVPSVTLMQILSSLDDHFLKASETAQDVSKMLEATRLHYHSNFADGRGNVFSIRFVSFIYSISVNVCNCDQSFKSRAPQNP